MTCHRNDDVRRRAYLGIVFDRLRGPDRERIVAAALALVDKWESSTGVNPFYVSRWRRLLAGQIAEMSAEVLADSEQGAELRHCMPFAGLLTNRERAELRRT